MGLIHICLDILYSVATFTPFNPWTEVAQKPFLEDSSQSPLLSPPSTPVTFHPEGSSPGFTCVYPELEKQGWISCNTETTRDCWLRDPASVYSDYSQIDINTDYENPDDTPQGITREYWLNVTGDVEVTADGFLKTSGKTFNDTYPGPLLEACWGDELVIHITNLNEENGTTIHWHGIRQLNTNQMDGVNGVTQCPIAYNDTFTYKFKALQYGHTWYHSHYSLQYSDGMAGPLIIHGPSSGNWDIDVGPILIQDYVHDSAFVRYDMEKTAFAEADSIVVNGTGHDPKTGTGAYFETSFTRGKKHLLRLINGSAGTHYIFSIDNHNMTVIANDLVPIEPYNTSSLSIGIGQRYMVVVDANQEPGEYWIRTHPATGCNAFTGQWKGGNPGIFNDTFEPFNVTTGIIRYASADGSVPTGTAALPDPTTTPHNYSRACLDEPYESLRPKVPWYIDRHPQNNISESRFTAAHQLTPDEPGNYTHWMLTPDFLWLDFGNPTLLNLDAPNPSPNFRIVQDNFTSGYVFMIIEAAINSPTIPDTSVPKLSHPLHWHGSDVVVLAQNSTPFDNKTSYSTFNFNNPPRRDVVLLPAGGYIAVAFRPDNPGVWLVHCHIAWHASAGLGLQIIQGGDDIVPSLGPGALDETVRVCDNWNKYNGVHPVAQDDSGI
ncbi:Multicopper oxidase [Pleurostoma richardsiae]|uniref:Multicopper oxidase n=1 Tax=Pleurostoma richardsiae TaxID=41990 RepID=A0AA38RIY2_9PEZI|nr:Multicopper oxidase [Pleurostoma richardsiae]